MVGFFEQKNNQEDTDDDSSDQSEQWVHFAQALQSPKEMGSRSVGFFIEFFTILLNVNMDYREHFLTVSVISSSWGRINEY